MAGRALPPLIFDMDGTMIDSMPCHTRSWGLFCRRHGLELDIEEVIRRTAGRTALECMDHVFGRPVAADEALRLVQEKEAIYRELFAPEFRPVGGYKAFLAAAVNGQRRWGIGTAGDQKNLAFALQHLQLDEAPHAVASGDEGLRGKPEPDIFLAVAQRMGVEPADCIVFEDAPLGIEAARRAGMRAIAICTGHTPETLQGPHVLAAVPDYHALLQHPAWETLHAS